MQSAEWDSFAKAQKEAEKKVIEETKTHILGTIPPTKDISDLVPMLHDWRLKSAQAKAAADAIEELLTHMVRPDTAVSFERDGYKWRVEHNIKQRNTVDKKALHDELGGVPASAMPSIVDVDLTIKLSKIDSMKLSVEERELLAKVVKISNSSEIKITKAEASAVAAAPSTFTDF